MTWHRLPILLHAAREKPLFTDEAVAVITALSCDPQAPAIWLAHFEDLRGIAGDKDDQQVPVWVPPLRSQSRRAPHGFGFWLSQLLAPDWEQHQVVVPDQKKGDEWVAQPVGDQLTVDLLPDWSAAYLIAAAGQPINRLSALPSATSLADLAAIGKALVAGQSPQPPPPQ